MTCNIDKVESRFDELYKPLALNGMKLKNRWVMVPMGTKLCTSDGFVTQQLIDHYEARARGGVGLVIVEVTSIDLKSGRTTPRMVSIESDKHLDGLSRLAEAIHRGGAKVAIQIHHGGRLARVEHPIAPSPVKLSSSRHEPREMTVPDIEHVVSLFAQAARRAASAGFDGVEIHGAHHYLVAQFLSAASNKRQDEWGGDLNRRARFMQEVIKAARRELGPDYPLWIRLSAVEHGLENGITLEETEQVARLAERAGSDAVSVSCWGFGPYAIKLCPHTPGEFIPLAAAVKRSVSVPVIAVGRMGPALGCRILREGKADLVGLGRALLADPEYPLKVASDRIQEIRHCIGCQECWAGEYDPPIRCTVNPAVGRENEMEIRPSTKGKNVLVLGGGPAGMEAARVAALRGHTVSLWEKTGRLGGQLLVADKAPAKNHIRAFKNYLAHQMDLLGVRVTLHKEAIADDVVKGSPDVVIVAVGPAPFIPPIPGLDRIYVMKATDVLSGKAVAGCRVVVIGAERVGCEVACFLAGRGAQVTVTRRGESVAMHLSGLMRRGLSDRMKDLGVRVLTGVSYKEATQRGLVVRAASGDVETLEADTLVVAAACQPDLSLAHQLGPNLKVCCVGDCVGPRDLSHALREGYLAGLNV